MQREHCRGERDRTSDFLVPNQARYHFATPRRLRRERRDRTDRVLHMKQPSPPGDLLAKAWSPGLSPSCALASSPRSPSARPRPREQDAGESNAVTTTLEIVPRPSRASYEFPRRPGLTPELSLRGLPTRGVAIAHLGSVPSKQDEGPARTDHRGSGGTPPRAVHVRESASAPGRNCTSGTSVRSRVL